MSMNFEPCLAWGPEIYADSLACHGMFKESGIVYLDNAATTPRFASSARAQSDCESGLLGNPGRGSHRLSASSSMQLEQARSDVGHFLGLDKSCVAFVSGSTEAVNLLAESCSPIIDKTSVIYATEMEHHSNYLPWQKLAASRNAKFKTIPVLEDGSLDLFWFEQNVEADKPVIVAVTAMSNVTGFMPSVDYISRLAKEADPNCVVVVDAAQAVMQKRSYGDLWGGDVAFFSGHKMHSVSGVGVIAVRDSKVWGRLSHGKVGGGVVKGFDDGVFKLFGGHVKFEAGSPNVSGAVALADTVNILSKWDWSLMSAHKACLSSYAEERLKQVDGLFLIGQGLPARGVVSFFASWGHSHDIGTVLDACDVMVRVGQHCALPYLKGLGVESCARVSMGFFNTVQDVDKLIVGLERAREVLRG